MAETWIVCRAPATLTQGELLEWLRRRAEALCESAGIGEVLLSELMPDSLDDDDGARYALRIATTGNSAALRGRLWDLVGDLALIGAQPEVFSARPWIDASACATEREPAPPRRRAAPAAMARRDLRPPRRR